MPTIVQVSQQLTWGPAFSICFPFGKTPSGEFPSCILTVRFFPSG